MAQKINHRTFTINGIEFNCKWFGGCWEILSFRAPYKHRPDHIAISGMHVDFVVVTVGKPVPRGYLASAFAFDQAKDHPVIRIESPLENRDGKIKTYVRSVLPAVEDIHTH